MRSPQLEQQRHHPDIISGSLWGKMVLNWMDLGKSCAFQPFSPDFVICCWCETHCRSRNQPSCHDFFDFNSKTRWTNMRKNFHGKSCALFSRYIFNKHHLYPNIFHWMQLSCLWISLVKVTLSKKKNEQRKPAVLKSAWAFKGMALGIANGRSIQLRPWGGHHGNAMQTTRRSNSWGMPQMVGLVGNTAISGTETYSIHGNSNFTKKTRPHSGPKEWQHNARSCFFLSTQCRSNLATCCAAHISLEATNNQRKKQTASKKQWKMASTWYWTSSVSGWPKV